MPRCPPAYRPLFRAHVGSCAKNHARPRHCLSKGRGVRGIKTLGFLGESFRQTEVQYLDLVSFGDHHIGWLQIPMGHAFFMRCLEPFGYLSADAQNLVNRQRPFAQPLRQRIALDKLQNDEAFFLRPVQVRIWQQCLGD